MEWKPIETAPEGKDILLFVPRRGLFLAMKCDAFGGMKFLDWNAYEIKGATHWMLLPEPPKQQ